MRRLETCLAVGNGATLALGVLLVAGGTNLQAARWAAVCSGLSLALVLLHLVQEGYRWQMLPQYALAFVLAVPLARLLLGRPATGVINQFQGAALLGLGIALPVLLPVPRLPAPRGRYPIGTHTLWLVDRSRPEKLAGDGRRRELMVQVWYPAGRTTSSAAASWIENWNVVEDALARRLRWPRFLLHYAGLARTHAVPDVPLAEGPGPFPVILYSHGWTGFRTASLPQVEALASRGYVVVTIDHPYAALVTCFPDGRVVMNDSSYLGMDIDEELLRSRGRSLIDMYAEDVIFVLNELDRGVRGAFGARFAGRLDLERVGVLGHSMGGAAAVCAAQRDDRIRAGVGLDAWVWPMTAEQLATSLSQPFLFMSSERWSRSVNEVRVRDLYLQAASECYRVVVRGILHRDFTIQPLLSPVLPLLGLSGSVPAHRLLDIIEDYVVAFFEQHLEQKETPLLEIAASYPEVVFEHKPAQAKPQTIDVSAALNAVMGG